MQAEISSKSGWAQISSCCVFMVKESLASSILSINFRTFAFDPNRNEPETPLRRRHNNVHAPWSADSSTTRFAIIAGCYWAARWCLRDFCCQLPVSCPYRCCWMKFQWCSSYHWRYRQKRAPARQSSFSLRSNEDWRRRELNPRP